MPLSFWPFRRRREPVVVRITHESNADLAAAIKRMIRTGELGIGDLK